MVNGDERPLWRVHSTRCTLVLAVERVVASKQKRVKKAMVRIRRHHLLELHTITDSYGTASFFHFSSATDPTYSGRRNVTH